MIDTGVFVLMALQEIVSQQEGKPLYYPYAVNVWRQNRNRHVFKPLISGSSEVPGSITTLTEIVPFILSVANLCRL